MKTAISVACVAVAMVSLAGLGPARPAADPRPNVILFVPDGLRSLAVNRQAAPALAALRDRGVNFKNSHSLFPTVTMANASAMATGHYFGDTGAFSNTIFTGFPSPAAQDSVTPFMEHDGIIGDVDAEFGGDYLGETTILAAARAAGIQTAAVGKLGPTLLLDHTNRTGAPTIVIDDSTGTSSGVPLSAATQAALMSAGLPLRAPSRGDNGKSGGPSEPGTLVANVTQQNYFADVVTKAVLPTFKKSGAPFLIVFWSRDPDGTQHNQGDSLNQLTPGINGPTSRAALANVDDDLARIEAALDALGLAATTDIVVAADHGFSTISKQSGTSPSARATYPELPAGLMPPGFLSIDLAAALKLPLFDPDSKNARVPAGTFSTRGNGLIGLDPKHPDIAVAANGGSDLIYLPAGDKTLAARVTVLLAEQDYVSAVFVDDALGSPPGTLPLSAINLKGSSRTPTPSIVVGFKTFMTGCEEPLLCAVEVADYTLQQGQGNHGSFSRADTMNFMAAAGPDFKAGWVDPVPASNADIGRTLAQLLGLRIAGTGKLMGRVLTEALKGGIAQAFNSATLRAAEAAGAVRTELVYQRVGETRYFDMAGTPGRTLGLGTKR